MRGAYSSGVINTWSYNMTKSPSRVAGYSNLMIDAVARDGLVCFLCGHIHSRSDTMQVDFRKPLDSGGTADADNAIPTCKTCAKRRNQSPIGAYWRKRLVDAQREIAYIHQMAEDAEIMKTLAASVQVSRDVPLRDITGAEIEAVEEVAAEPAGEPWENLKRRVRLYNSNTLRPEEMTIASFPKDAQHGDMYVDHNTGAASIYDSADDMWIADDIAQDTGVVPEKWPPRDIETWNR